MSISNTQSIIQPKLFLSGKRYGNDDISVERGVRGVNQMDKSMGIVEARLVSGSSGTSYQRSAISFQPALPL
jgi:hypothetical protein